MAVKIRLKKLGHTHNAFYRVVVADSHYPRNGRFIEEIGYYNPYKDPSEIKINADAYYLIGKILYVQGDKKGAVSFVKKAISLEGAHEEANDLLIEIKKDLKS